MNEKLKKSIVNFIFLVIVLSVGAIHAWNIVNYFRVGPNSVLNFLTIPVDTPLKYSVYIFVIFILAYFEVFRETDAQPTLYNGPWDEKVTEIDMYYTEALLLVNLIPVCENGTKLIMMYSSFSQVDLFLANILSLIVWNTLSFRRATMNKTFLTLPENSLLNRWHKRIFGVKQGTHIPEVITSNEEKVITNEFIYDDDSEYNKNVNDDEDDFFKIKKFEATKDNYTL